LYLLLMNKSSLQKRVLPTNPNVAKAAARLAKQILEVETIPEAMLPPAPCLMPFVQNAERLVRFPLSPVTDVLCIAEIVFNVVSMLVRPLWAYHFIFTKLDSKERILLMVTLNRKDIDDFIFEDDSTNVSSR